MNISYTKNKVLHFIAFFLQNFPNLGITKLYKVMSFADFYHIKKTGKSISDFTYVAYKFGPVPIQMKKGLEDADSFIKKNIIVKDIPFQKRKVITSKVRYDSKFFSELEQETLKSIIYIFKDVIADDIVLASHENNSPWDVTQKEKGLGKVIDPILALVGSKISKDEYFHLKEEENEFRKMFA